MSATFDRYREHLRDTPEDAVAERMPEIVVLSAPEDDLEALALQKLRGVAPEVDALIEARESGLHLGWGYNEASEAVFNGRMCCATLIDGLVRIGPARLEIPSDHHCPGCRTHYRIQWPPMELF